ncbi:MAG TPA: methyltransferase domain-containing protein [Anaerohalosphaeraceae bacterium]|nr:methyltransferase domain-containing protein [Anaerohalosphaeraceae bacterium]
MQLIKRDNCVFSDKQDLEHLYTFRDFPVFMGCVDHAADRDLKVDMSWWISRSTGSIQLNPLVPLDVLYGSGHGSGSVGKLWRRHHSAFAEFMGQYGPKKVLEIGGGHGILAANYLQLRPDANWTIIEPNPTVPSDARIHIVRGFFGPKFVSEEEIDSVVHSHVLEHIYEPMDFMASISRLLGDGQRHLFSVPNQQIMLKRKYTNCINFEHTVFLTEPFIDYILRRNNFRIEGKQYFLEDHSIFYSAIREEQSLCPACPDEYEKNRGIYEDYICYHKELIRELNARMKNHQGEIYLFGAHIFAQYLLNFGLDESRIRYLLDNDSAKQNRRLAGSQLWVKSPGILREAKSPAVILRAGAFQSEIKNDILDNINPGVVFWE